MVKGYRGESCKDAIRDAFQPGRVLTASELFEAVRQAGDWSESTITQHMMACVVNLPPARRHWRSTVPFLFIRGDGRYELYDPHVHPAVQEDSAAKQAAAGATATRTSIPAPTFRSLGVRPLINCRGTYTILTGSRALDVSAEAMRRATDHYVRMEELIAAVGQRLAELTGAEWGYIASGCAAALTEITAACMAGGDPEKMARLPDTAGMPNEVIMQSGHRNTYDRSMRLAGAVMVEIETLAELEAMIGPRTAMLAITGDQSHLGRIPVAEMIAVGKRRGIPVLVDAAAERPDVPNSYLEMGADAVAYSGGKCLRGPQASGLVLGCKALLEAACRNSAPFHGVARPMKAGKEEIMGLLAAVEAWILGRDHEAEWRDWEGYLERIRASVADLPTMASTIQQPGIANVAPTLYLSWDAGALGHAPEQVRRALWEGDPRIAVFSTDDGIRVMPYMMETGEDAIVARRLHEVLTTPAEAAGAGEPAPVEPQAPIDIAGEWLLSLTFVWGSAEHALRLEQCGETLSGIYHTPYNTATLEGQVRGDAVSLGVTLGYESNQVRYAFTATCQDGTMEGEVDLGEFGQGRWQARRISAPQV